MSVTSHVFRYKTLSKQSIEVTLFVGDNAKVGLRGLEFTIGPPTSIYHVFSTNTYCYSYCWQGFGLGLVIG